ncbi:hypothetical protein EYY09_21225, partial [Escherichia coli]
NSNENFSMHPQFLVWCLTFGAQFKNDGHYFCRAGGNRPDGLNEPVTSVVQMATTMARGKAAITFFREPPATSCDSRCSCRTARIACRGPGNPQYQL